MQSKIIRHYPLWLLFVRQLVDLSPSPKHNCGVSSLTAKGWYLKKCGFNIRSQRINTLFCRASCQLPNEIPQIIKKTPLNIEKITKLSRISQKMPILIDDKDFTDEGFITDVFNFAVAFYRGDRYIDVFSPYWLNQLSFL